MIINKVLTLIVSSSCHLILGNTYKIFSKPYNKYQRILHLKNGLLKKWMCLSIVKSRQKCIKIIIKVKGKRIKPIQLVKHQSLLRFVFNLPWRRSMVIRTSFLLFLFLLFFLFTHSLKLQHYLIPYHQVTFKSI